MARGYATGAKSTSILTCVGALAAFLHIYYMSLAHFSNMVQEGEVVASVYSTGNDSGIGPYSSSLLFTEFEKTQLARSECASIVHEPSLWRHTSLNEKNVFLVWAGPRTIPDRALYSVASAAAVYGQEWTITVATTTDMPNLLDRVYELLADVQQDCKSRMGSLRHIVVDVLSLLQDDLQWPAEKVGVAQAIFEKGGSVNDVTVSDIIRVALVYQNGGVYMDMDNIALYPILRPTIAVNCGGPECYPWGPAGLQLTEGMAPTIPITCMANGLFAFQRRSPLLQHYLEEMTSHLDFDKWGVIGPQLFLHTIDWAHRWHPHLLQDISAMNVKCMLCSDQEGEDLGTCTNFTYLSYGKSDGGLPMTAQDAYQAMIRRVCR